MPVRSNTCTKLEHVFERIKDQANRCSNGVSPPLTLAGAAPLWPIFLVVIGGALAGGLLASVLAVLSIRYRVDQIIAGVAINLFVLGLTSYVSSQVFSEYRFLNNAPVFRAIAARSIGLGKSV